MLPDLFNAEMKGKGRKAYFNTFVLFWGKK